MIPDEHRFGMVGSCFSNDVAVQVYDADQRRIVEVSMPLPQEWSLTMDDEAHDALLEDLLDKAYQIVREHDDELGPDVVAIRVGESGRVTMSTDPDDDPTWGTYFVPVEEYQLPRHVGTILRSELTELDRLMGGVDLISYTSPLSNAVKKVVFKYFDESKAIPIFWKEINILLKLPPHPYILPLDRLVLEEINGSGVVGFTTPFIPDGNFDDNNSRPFKLKWLKQLMQAVDDLNLKFGIVHQDIAPRNLLLHPHTDAILLFDFDNASQIGVRWVRPGDGIGVIGEQDGRDDVKGVIFTLHELITRDPKYNGSYLDQLDEADVERPEKWIKHPDVQLDPGLDARDYYDELMRWVRKRRAGTQVKHYTEASQYIDWPAQISPAPTRTVERPSSSGKMLSFELGGNMFSRSQRRRYGVPFLEWQRPAASKVEPGRRLLATGKYADEDGGEGDAARHRSQSTEVGGGGGVEPRLTSAAKRKNDLVAAASPAKRQSLAPQTPGGAQTPEMTVDGEENGGAKKGSLAGKKGYPGGKSSPRKKGKAPVDEN